MKLHSLGTKYCTISSNDTGLTDAQFESYVDSLKVVFENGKLFNEQSFSEIRERVESNGTF